MRLSLWALTATALVAIVSPLYALGGDLRALGSAAVSAKARAVSLVPDGVPVSASVQLGGYLSERRKITTFPRVAHSRWIVLDIKDPTAADASLAAASLFRRSIRTYETDKAWRIVFSSHGVVVLHERSTHGA